MHETMKKGLEFEKEQGRLYGITGGGKKRKNI